MGLGRKSISLGGVIKKEIAVLIKNLNVTHTLVVLRLVMYFYHVSTRSQFLSPGNPKGDHPFRYIKAVGTLRQKEAKRRQTESKIS